MQTHVVSGFDLRIDGIWRSFRDQQPAAYDAASRLKKSTGRRP
jgi:hypothetical protein